jgi:serine protease
MKRAVMALFAVLGILPALAVGMPLDSAPGVAGPSILLTPGASGFIPATEPTPDDNYIVVFRGETVDRVSIPGAGRELAISVLAEEMAALHMGEVKALYTAALDGALMSLSERQARQLAANPHVAFVEKDGFVSLAATQNNPTWGLDRIDQRDRPLDNQYVYDTTATNVRAYIIDTGIRASHSDFGGRVLNGFTAINDGRGTSDCNGHGTHVAGTVGGATWGAAKGVRLHPVRVLNCSGGGTVSGVIAGVDWVTANHIKPAVANMSLGGGASSAIDTAVNNSINAGVTYVVAAGNDNANACNYSPARVSNAITVGSTTSSDSRSGFSNWGSCVNIFAPGSSIRSAWHTSNTATNTISGTSMAAPHVAGVAALFLANNPGASPATVRNAIYNNATTGRLTGIGTGSPNRLVYSRFGPPPCTGSGSVSNLSGTQGSIRRYTYSVPSCASQLTIRIFGGSGDADLYVRYGAQPTLSVWDCRPYLNGNNETCTFNNPQAGTWHIMIHGYRAYSGVTLEASYQ